MKQVRHKHGLQMLRKDDMRMKTKVAVLFVALIQAGAGFPAVFAPQTTPAQAAPPIAQPAPREPDRPGKERSVQLEPGAATRYYSSQSFACLVTAAP